MHVYPSGNSVGFAVCNLSPLFLHRSCDTHCYIICGEHPCMAKINGLLSLTSERHLVTLLVYVDMQGKDALSLPPSPKDTGDDIYIFFLLTLKEHDHCTINT